MLFVPVLVMILVLVAAIVGAVYSATPSAGRQRRRGLLIGSIVVGVLALTSLVLMLPAALQGHLKVMVIQITSGTN